MLDIKIIKENPEKFDQLMSLRGVNPQSYQIIKMHNQIIKLRKNIKNNSFLPRFTSKNVLLFFNPEYIKITNKIKYFQISTIFFNIHLQEHQSWTLAGQ